MSTAALGPLRERGFRTLWCGVVLSHSATWIHSVTLIALLASLSARDATLALAQAIRFTPLFLFCFPAGYLADMVDRRKALLLASIAAAAVSMALGVLSGTRFASTISALALAFLFGTCIAFIKPTWQAMIPDVVPPAMLRPAIALEAAGFNLAAVVGPGIAGGLLLIWAPGNLFFINALLLTWLPIALYRQIRRQPPVRPVDSAAADRSLGRLLRLISNERRARGTLLRTFCTVFFTSALWALLPVFALQRYPSQSTAYGLLLAAMGAGAVLGVAAVPRVERWAPGHGLPALGAMVFSLALALLATSARLPLSMGCVAGAGFAWTAIVTALNGAMIESSPAPMRSRLLAVWLMIFFASAALGSAVWATALERLGLSAALLCAAAGLALLAVPDALRLRNAVAVK